jgi:protein SCO1/2
MGASSVGAATAPTPPSSDVGVVTSIALPSVVKNATFVTASGKTTTLGALKGTTILVPFLTLCADVCPFTTGNLLQLAAHLHAHHDTGVQIVALSVDPGRDSQARLTAYAKRLGVSPSSTQLQFWRGSAGQTQHLTKFFGMRADHLDVESPAPKDWWTGKPITYDVDHSDGFFVINPQHQVKFISGLAPRFVGTLTKALKGYLTADGLETLAHPGPGWTPAQALQALSYVAKRSL